MAIKRVPSSIQYREKNLLSDQPGMVFTITGIILAWVLSMVFKGLVSPDKIISQIISEMKNSEPSIEVEIGSAKISLANGWWPELALVLEQAKLKSTKSCLMSPSAEIDEVRVPIDAISAIQGKKAIKKVAFNSIKLVLREELRPCQNNASLIAPHTRLPMGGPETDTDSQQQQQSQPGRPNLADLPKISVKSLMINYAPKNLDLEILNLVFINEKSDSSVDPTSNSTRNELTAQLNMGSLVGESLTPAEMHFEMQQQQISGIISGHWREGNYHIEINKDENGPLQVNSTWKHFPAYQVIPILKKMNLISSEFQNKQFWFSGSISAKGDFENLKQTPIIANNFYLEGDLGDWSSEHIQLNAFDPLDLEPFTIDVKDLELEKLASFLGKGHPSPALGHLGTFDGHALIEGANKAQIEGKLKGLQLIFSSRGRRETQQVSEINGRLFYDGRLWTGKLDRLELEDGKFDGYGEVVVEHGFRGVALKGVLKEIEFSPDVQKLVTAGGWLKPISGELGVNFVGGEITGISGTLKIPEANVDQVDINGFGLTLGYLNEEVVMEPRIDSIRWAKNSPIFEKLSGILPVTKQVQTKTLQMKQIHGTFRSHALKDLTWVGVKAQLDNGTKLTSDGGWDSSGNVSGKIFSRHSLGQTSWTLSGTRSEPIVTKAK